MFELLRIVLIYPWSLLGRRHEVALEVLALRHQIKVLKRRTPRPKLRWWDRCLWVMLKRAWPGWKTPLIIFRPETVIGWQRAGLRMFWRWKSRRRRGRPAKDSELIQLIRRMWSVNPTWAVHASATNWPSWVCRLRRPLSESIAPGPEAKRHRAGGPFSRTMRVALPRWISLWFRR